MEVAGAALQHEVAGEVAAAFEVLYEAYLDLVDDAGAAEGEGEADDGDVHGLRRRAAARAEELLVLAFGRLGQGEAAATLESPLLQANYPKLCPVSPPVPWSEAVIWMSAATPCSEVDGWWRRKRACGRL